MAAGSITPFRLPDKRKLCHFSLSSQTTTAESTSGLSAPSIHPRSAAVNI